MCSTVTFRFGDSYYYWQDGYFKDENIEGDELINLYKLDGRLGYNKTDFNKNA